MMLKLASDDELIFVFNFILRRAQSSSSLNDAKQGSVDTHIGSLTFVHGSSPKEVDNIVTREFHADPNLHKNPQVALLGDYSTGGSPSVTFEWTWKWKPPKPLDDRAGGWRNACSVSLGYFLPLWCPKIQI